MRELRRAVALALGMAFAADRWRALVTFVALPAYGLFDALQPFWFKLLLDGVTTHDRVQVLIAAVAEGAIVVASLFFVIGWVASDLRLREGIDRELDHRLMQLSAGLPGIEHHERPDFLDRLELLRTQRSAFAGLVSSLGTGLQLIVAITTTALLLLNVHPLLLTLPIFAIPSLLLANSGERRLQAVEEGTAGDQRRVLHLFGLATGPAEAKEIRVFGLQNTIAMRHRELQSRVDDRITTAYTGMALRRSAGFMLFGLGYMAAVGVVVAEAAGGRASAGDVLLAVTAAARIRDQVGGAAGLIQGLLVNRRIVGRFLWLLDYANEEHRASAPPAGTAVPPPDCLVDGITFEDVTFRYPGEGQYVLQDLNVHIPAGSVVAVVGENGAGKSTFVKLMARFYHPTSGRILVDGAPLETIDLERWRASTSAVFQDFVHYDLLLREVVGIGDLPWVDDARAVEGALARADASRIVEDLPAGLSTLLGTGSPGARDLSKGQWQKLSLARGLMRVSPLLFLLDEPTAALDAETEHALFESYASQVRASQDGSVTVLVSHRFSTVRMADLILVLRDGRIVEQGSHDELIACGGLYADLYSVQADGYR